MAQQNVVCIAYAFKMDGETCIHTYDSLVDILMHVRKHFWLKSSSCSFNDYCVYTVKVCSSLLHSVILLPPPSC